MISVERYTWRPGMSRNDQSVNRDRARRTGGSGNGWYWGGGRFTRQEQSASTHCEACRGRDKGRETVEPGGGKRVSREGYRDRSLQLAQNFLCFSSQRRSSAIGSRYNHYLPLNCVWSRDIMGRTSAGSARCVIRDGKMHTSRPPAQTRARSLRRRSHAIIVAFEY